MIWPAFNDEALVRAIARHAAALVGVGHEIDDVSDLAADVRAATQQRRAASGTGPWGVVERSMEYGSEQCCLAWSGGKRIMCVVADGFVAEQVITVGSEAIKNELSYTLANCWRNIIPKRGARSWVCFSAR